MNVKGLRSVTHSTVISALVARIGALPGVPWRKAPNSLRFAE
jgi:hypothetical protein